MRSTLSVARVAKLNDPPGSLTRTPSTRTCTWSDSPPRRKREVTAPKEPPRATASPDANRRASATYSIPARSNSSPSITVLCAATVHSGCAERWAVTRRPSRLTGACAARADALHTAHAAAKRARSSGAGRREAGCRRMSGSPVPGRRGYRQPRCPEYGPPPPRGGVCWAPDGHVSWLEVALTRLPGTAGGPSGTSELAFRETPEPLTVAGPRRTCTGFRQPLRPNMSTAPTMPSVPPRRQLRARRAPPTDDACRGRRTPGGRRAPDRRQDPPVRAETLAAARCKHCLRSCIMHALPNWEESGTGRDSWHNSRSGT